MVTPAAVRTVTRSGRVSLRVRNYNGDYEKRSVTSPSGRYWVSPQFHLPDYTNSNEWLDTVTGRVLQLTDAVAPLGPLLVDDSGRVLVDTASSPYLLQPQTGQQTPVTGLPAFPDPAAMSGDGRFIVLRVRRGDYEGLVLVDGRDGTTRDIMDGTNDPFIDNVMVSRTGRVIYGVAGRFWMYGPNDAPRRLITWPTPTARYGNPDLSENGRFLTFRTGAPLLPGDDALSPDVFQADLVNRTLRWVSRRAIRWRNPDLERLDFNAYYGPVASPDGRFVSFVNNPDIAGESGQAQTFLWDRTTGRYRIVSRDLRGKVGNSDSLAGAVTTAGTVSFLSAAGNLIRPRTRPRAAYNVFTWRP